MNYKCSKCSSEEMFVEGNGGHTGLYCAKCGKWVKWLSKDEARLLRHQISNNNMNYKCSKCSSEEMFIEGNGGHTGLYCAKCGKWVKWLSKDEARLLRHQISSNSPHNFHIDSPVGSTHNLFDCPSCKKKVPVFIERSDPHSYCLLSGEVTASLHNGSRAEVFEAKSITASGYTGIYCKNCGKWIKWAEPKELRGIAGTDSAW